MCWQRRQYERRYCDYRVGLCRPPTGKNIRKTDTTTPLTLIASDSMDEYNKPDLSHVISLGQRARDLTRQSAGISPSSSTCACFPTRG